MEESLFDFNRSLAQKFEAFFTSGVIMLPWIQEGIAHARTHGAFTMQLPQIDEKSHLVFTSEGVQWFFLAEGLTDDYYAVVNNDHWQLYHDRYDTGQNLACLTTDDPPYIGGVNAAQLKTLVSNVEHKLDKFIRIYMGLGPLKTPANTPEPKQSNGAMPYVIAGVFTLLILLVLCCGLVVAFANMTDN